MHTSEFHAKNRLLSFLIVGIVLLCAVAAQAKTASEIFEAVSPSIVVVETFYAEGKPLGLGSGVVLADGLIVTNCHVIKGATSMKVVYRKTAYPASPRQTDWDRDVCTLVVKGLQAPPATLGGTNRLKVGQQVYAVGAPQGLDLTLSNGIVSSLRPVDGGQYLQITAPISPGSSGGGLFDDEGRLIGLPTFYLAEGQQLNFAVPVEWIKELSERQTTTPQKTTQGTAQNSKSATIDWLNKAIALEEKKDWQGLQAHALRWTQAMPRNSVAWFALGIAYDEIKQYPKAIEAYQQAIRINPEHANAWYNLGNAYKLNGQTGKVMDVYKRLKTLDPDMADEFFNKIVLP